MWQRQGEIPASPSHPPSPAPPTGERCRRDSSVRQDPPPPPPLRASPSSPSSPVGDEGERWGGAGGVGEGTGEEASSASSCSSSMTSARSPPMALAEDEGWPGTTAQSWWSGLSFRAFRRRLGSCSMTRHFFFYRRTRSAATQRSASPCRWARPTPPPPTPPLRLPRRGACWTSPVAWLVATDRSSAVRARRPGPRPQPDAWSPPSCVAAGGASGTGEEGRIEDPMLLGLILK